MTKKIFHSILLVAGTVLLASLLVIMGCLYEYFGSVEKKQLRDELELAAVAVKENGTEYLSQLSSERYRLTWIENDGTVLYDTVTDAESLENHADRVEVKQALEYGEGESTRYSSTLLQKTMYCAERLADGSVLRISMSRATAGVLLVGMGQPILAVLIVALILSSVLAKSLSHRIVQPLNKLDLEHPLENDAYEELAPLLGRINRQHLQIDEQMDELQRQQTEFSQITSSMREGLVLLDEKEHVLSINPAACRIFEADETCLGQDFLTVDRSRDVSAALEEAMASGHSEVHVQRPGRIYQFDISRIRSGQDVLGAVLLAFDITQQETAEQSRREFTANVSHELKTPMTTIAGYTDGILDGTIPPEQEKEYLRIISDEARRLSRLVRRMLEVSQLQSRDLTRTKAPFDVCESMRRVLISMEKKITDRGLDVDADIPDSGIMVLGDNDLITQVIYNLLENAAKFARKGSALYLGVTTLNGKALISVRNEGDTIPAEEIPLLFERFHKSDKSRSEDKDGVGLGLYVVKTILDQHKEHIAVTSENGLTTFTFSVTLAGGQTAQ